MQNLTPFNSVTGSIAGSKKRKPSKKRSLSAKLAWLRKKGMPGDKIDDMLGFLEDPTLASADVYVYLHAIKSMTKDPNVMIKLADSMMKLHKTIHGDKLKIQADIRSQVTVIKGYQSFSPDEWDEHKQEVIDVTPEEGE